MKLLSLFILLIALVGCATPGGHFASRIGCAQDDLQILDTRPGTFETASYTTVQCHGKRYICSQRPHENLNCTYTGFHHKSEDQLGVENLQGEKNFDEFMGDLEKKSEKQRRTK